MQLTVRVWCHRRHGHWTQTRSQRGSDEVQRMAWPGDGIKWHDITRHHMTLHDMTQLTTLPHLTSPHHQPHYLISPRNQLHEVPSFGSIFFWSCDLMWLFCTFPGWNSSTSCRVVRLPFLIEQVTNNRWKQEEPLCQVETKPTTCLWRRIWHHLSVQTN